MANVTKLNGYDIKDSAARSACNSLDSRVTVLEQSGGLTVVDTVQDGNMNAVTSNAVYDAVDTLNTALTAENKVIVTDVVSYYQIGNLVVINVVLATYNLTSGWKQIASLPFNVEERFASAIVNDTQGSAGMIRVVNNEVQIIPGKATKVSGDKITGQIITIRTT